MEYRTKGVCSQMIKLDVDDNDVIQSVEFVGGCDGNAQGVARLVEGMKVLDAISRIEGIRCGGKATSCPDQLAQALKLATGR
ncbi:MAG: TIGR03905 family TSCPD domain-containing protein [Lachnospiraceae bacterium]